MKKNQETPAEKPDKQPLAPDIAPEEPHSSDSNETQTSESPVVAVNVTPEGEITEHTDYIPENQDNIPDSEDCQPVASATPDGALTVTIPAEGNEEYVPRKEVERLRHEAWLDGRNEAVRAKIARETTLPQGDGTADWLNLRSSVWPQ